MKAILILFIFIISLHTSAQQGWVNIGKEIGYDFYYKENTIIRGNNTFVVVVGVPLQEMKDGNNTVIKYVTINITFYDSPTGIRCIISNHLFFYDDKTYKKAGLPKRDVPVTYYNLLMKLYDAIK
jgi:hypothetical protein